MPGAATRSLIAPCGMNCGICAAYLRERNKCAGCRASGVDNPITRRWCKIKRCAVFKDKKVRFCYQCAGFPCGRLKHLDKRYRKNYGMSMVDNLLDIKKTGIRRFLKKEHKRWLCPRCGGPRCVHKGYCLACGK